MKKVFLALFLLFQWNDVDPVVMTFGHHRYEKVCVRGFRKKRGEKLARFDWNNAQLILTPQEAERARELVECV